MNIKFLLRLIGNPIVAFLVIALISTFIMHFFAEATRFIIVVVVAFFVSDIISSIFSRRGIFQIPS